MQPGQTPVNAVKAGGAGLFSAKCAKLLRRVGLDPDDFGTHTNVAERLGQVRKNHGLDQNGEPDPENPKPGDAPARAKMLAASQAGHMVQNAVLQEAGERAANDPCGVPPPPPAGPGLSDGSMLPCMPLSGNAVGTSGIMHRVGTSGEITASNREKMDQAEAEANGDPDARYSNPGGPHDGKLRYRAEHIEMDYQSNNFLVANCLASLPKTKKVLGEFDDSGIYKKDRKPDAASHRADEAEKAHARQRAAAEELAASDPAKAGKPSVPNDVPLLDAAEVKALADCLDNFVKAMIAQMQNKLIEDEENGKNAEKKANAQKGKAKAEQKIAESKAKQEELQKEKDALPPPPKGKKQRAALDEEIAKEQAAEKKAQASKERAENAIRKGDCRSAAVAKFKEAEARGEIERGQLQDGVCPSPSITQTDVVAPKTPKTPK